MDPLPQRVRRRGRKRDRRSGVGADAGSSGCGAGGGVVNRPSADAARAKPRMRTGTAGSAGEAPLAGEGSGSARAIVSGAGVGAGAGSQDAGAGSGGGGQQRDVSEATDGKQVVFVDFEPNVTEKRYEWGKTLASAFEQVAVAMFGYMTELDTVSIDNDCSRTLQVQGHDYQSLLYNFLDELLFAFCGDDFVCKDVKVVEFDEDRLRITVSCKGERFDLGKHPQGTEVKAITYSNMQIHKPRAASGDAAASATPDGGNSRPGAPGVTESPTDDGLFHVYVIIDI